MVGIQTCYTRNTLDCIRALMDFIGFVRSWLLLSCRLHSQGKRTLERNKGNFNGRMHRGHCMDYNHLTPRCSLSAHISMNSIKWPKKLSGEPKLQGMDSYNFKQLHFLFNKEFNWGNNIITLPACGIRGSCEFESIPFK